MLRRLASLALATLAGCAPGGDLTVPPPPSAPTDVRLDLPLARDDGRLPSDQRPLRYRLDLDVDPRAKTFGGTVDVDVQLDRPTRAVVLHAADLTIEQAFFATSEAQIPAETSTRLSAGAVSREEELVVVADEELSAGDVTLHLAFTGPLPDSLRGIYRATKDGRPFVFTQFEPSDARRAFPCFDDPGYKVRFDLSITAPAEDAVFANTREREAVELEDGRVRHVFARTEPLPTYLVAFAVGPLKTLTRTDEPRPPLRVVAPAGSEGRGALARSIAREHLELLEAYFEHPYPYDKLDLVAVPDFAAGAMENAGLITFREELLLADEDAVSTEARKDIATVIAHELAHQWFGNLVTMKWWDDLWLNEGFATFMEATIVDRWEPDLGAGADLQVLGGRVMDLDALPSARAVRQPILHTYQAEEAFDGITYIKGARVIGMLEGWLGSERFREGVALYLDRHAFGSATASDLFAALTTASKKDVAQVAASFLDRPGVPLVRAELRCGRDQAPSVILRQEAYRNRPTETASEARWAIPACVRFGASTDLEEAGRTCALLEDAEQTVALDTSRCPTWLWPNDGHLGYYRYHLDEEAFEALADVVRAGPPAMKVGFLSNAWALVQAGELHAHVLLAELSRYAKGDQPRIVIEQLVELFEHIDDALVEPRARPRFERLVTSVLLPPARALGWSPRPGEDAPTKLRRTRLLDALATLTDDPWVRRNAVKVAQSYLDDPTSVDLDVAAVALPRAAHQGDIPFAKLRVALDATATSRDRIVVVRALAALPGTAVEPTLGLVSDGTIRAQDAVYVAREAARWPDTRVHLLQWLETHVDVVADRMPGFGLQRMISGLRRVCDRDVRDRAASALTAPLAQRGADRRLREALDAADACIDLRAREAVDATAHFEKKR